MWISLRGQVLGFLRLQRGRQNRFLQIAMFAHCEKGVQGVLPKSAFRVLVSMAEKSQDSAWQSSENVRARDGDKLHKLQLAGPELPCMISKSSVSRTIQKQM